jgi:peptidoglycan/LPS O-acetylase OafA/YrhL
MSPPPGAPSAELDTTRPIPADGAPPEDHPADVTQPGESRHAHFPGFDGLRAIAACAVLLHHAGFATGYSIRDRFGEYLAHGDAGVSIFFLISGFLLYRPFVNAHLGDRPTSKADRFWWRRALRIFPAYWVAVLVIYLAFGFGKGSLSTPGDIVTFFGLTQIYDTTRYFFGVNQAWSLATEVSFYVFLPFYAWAIRRIARSRPAHRLRIEIGGLVALVAICVVWRLAWFAYDPFWHRYAPDVPRPTGPAPFSSLATQYWLPSHLDLFALGMGLAVLSVWVTRRGVMPRWLDRAVHYPGIWWAAAAFTYWIACTQAGLPRNLVTLTGGQFFLRQLLYGLTALFLLVPAVFGPQDRGLVRKFLVWAPIAYVGLISYGIYLWHQAWLGFVHDDWLHLPEFQGPTFTLLAIAFPLTVITATASYYLIERPVLRWKDTPPWRRRTPRPAESPTAVPAASR